MNILDQLCESVTATANSLFLFINFTLLRIDQEISTSQLDSPAKLSMCRPWITTAYVYKDDVMLTLDVRSQWPPHRHISWYTLYSI
jgi:hypothetical protein